MGKLGKDWCVAWGLVISQVGTRRLGQVGAPQSLGYLSARQRGDWKQPGLWVPRVRPGPACDLQL